MDGQLSVVVNGIPNIVLGIMICRTSISGGNFNKGNVMKVNLMEVSLMEVNIRD